MHIHWFQHDNYEDLGYIGTWASKNGHSMSVTRFDLGDDLPKLENLDWLVIMGGKMGACEDDLFPFLSAEKEFIKDAVKSGKTVIGICLGSQLIASVLGAQVFVNKEPEIGFFPVTFTKEAKRDAVFRHFPETLNVLHIHNDTFILPEGAIRMASSGATLNQAFRFGRNVFAFQFHFEVTPDTISCFFSPEEQRPTSGTWIQDPVTILDQAPACISNNQLFDRVLDEIAMQGNF